MREIIVDPRGIEVILTDQCWTDHIVKKHPEMNSYKILVVETIKMPDAIYSGKRVATMEIYKKNYHSAPVGNWLDLLVFINSNRYVATAYFCAFSMRMLGVQVWPSK